MSNRDSAAYTTPPNNDQDDEFETWLIVAASFKIMQACYTVFEQSGYVCVVVGRHVGARSVDVAFVEVVVRRGGGDGWCRS